MTRAERDRVIEVADDAAAEEGLDTQTRRKRQATADLVAFLAGTGVRIDEVRRVLWSDVDLDAERVYIRGTKTETSDRRLNLPSWLSERLRARAARSGVAGLVFAAPASVGDPERVWIRATAPEPSGTRSTRRVTSRSTSSRASSTMPSART